MFQTHHSSFKCAMIHPQTEPQDLQIPKGYFGLLICLPRKSPNLSNLSTQTLEIMNSFMQLINNLIQAKILASCVKMVCLYRCTLYIFRYMRKKTHEHTHTFSFFTKSLDYQASPNEKNDSLILMHSQTMAYLFNKFLDIFAQLSYD